MNSIINYLKNSFYEFKNHVEWPKWKILQQSTLIIGFSSLILSIFIFIVDFIFSNTVKLIYKITLNFFNPKI